MPKLILHLRRNLPYDEIERLEAQIKKELDENGFAIIDDSIDIYVIDDDNNEKRAD